MKSNRNNIAVIISNNQTNIQPNIHSAMLEVGQSPILCHIIQNISKTNIYKIIIVHDNQLSSNDKELICNHSILMEKKIKFVKVDFTSSSRKITSDIFNAVPENTSSILLIGASAPFIRAYSMHAALNALDTKHDFNVLMPSFVALGIKYSKLDQEIKNNIANDSDGFANNNDESLILHNTAVMAAHAKFLEKVMSDSIKREDEISVNNIIINAINNGATAIYVETLEEEILTITNKQKLLLAEHVFQKCIRNQMIEQGVKMIAPDTVFFTANTKVAANVIIHPYVIFEGRVVVKEGSEIKSFSHIAGAYLEENTTIGPFARIRPDSIIKQNAKIGNFVEIKQSAIMPKAKIPHMSYIGNAVVGAETNIGAGSITCNYNGFHKNDTIIGNNCFIGANTSLIAPVQIGDNATIAAGSVITKNVDENSLAISRCKQHTKKGKRYLGKIGKK
ncbi:putative UDP-N-acetylglucosamine pyrophosphorylase / Glucosamine-1-phosphate N-acetyltransferase [Candidatus Xenohaliotis californiensis]|uniref:UDP-N-acetylglucosamine pyrophosphorylase / Glucosamine-1-phosphate N-acetyltransferase n=1 Tax=Candidatus Xenohaliotis californiensis TaxID=84677 RepID=A0ABM9N8Q6_9RICK|nr:putative UDP-N-acetylglucosamine pyrophosphorylase / Glucosamine-1-phosphate N-acetyltransferase [Candidatus Xenohaliotis californiensis]